MQGKRGLIMGLANDKSIAWGIAKACAGAGRGTGLLLSGRGAEEARRTAGRLELGSDICPAECDVGDEPRSTRCSPR
jgi:enoyl-[acyl-carrier protein] reductase I